MKFSRSDAPWADHPQLPAATDIYAWFADHGHPPRFTEHVRARMPLGDEATTLQMRPGVPLLVIARITHNTQPLALEEIRSPADQTEAAYTLPVTGTPTRSNRRRTTTSR